MLDERLTEVRDELQAGNVSPQVFVLLFNVLSDAAHAGDRETLTETLDLTRALTAAAPEGLKPEAERLAALCEEALDATVSRDDAASSRAAQPLTCPDCGNEIAPGAVRCRRCGRRSWTISRARRHFRAVWVAWVGWRKPCSSSGEVTHGRILCRGAR